MLGLIVIAIMMGFPTAFTLMGLGMIFGYLAFWDPAQHWWQNRVFDLIAQRTYGVMTNDTLLSVPLFVFMGYIMERAALVDRMFHSVQLAFRRVSASLAVTTLLVCAFWGIASGIVGAVVVLMGVIAMRPMLNAGYDVKLASGAHDIRSVCQMSIEQARRFFDSVQLSPSQQAIADKILLEVRQRLVFLENVGLEYL